MGETWTTLTDKERKSLKRSQFAFGTLYPYTFDGLAYVATHDRTLFQNHDEHYYTLELPINVWGDICLGGYQTHSKEHFMHELLRRGATTDKDEAKNLRCIPIGKGKYISFQPLMVGFTQKAQEDLSSLELKRLTNLRTFNEDTKKITTVKIYVIKQLIEPLYDDDDERFKGGWFSCPSALQAKINHTLKTDEQHFFDGLEPLFLRKYFLYLNIHDRSHDKDSYVDVNGIDLCEHISPSKINAEGTYKCIRNWYEVREKLERANEFFKAMETQGLMKGAKAYPTTCPRGVYYDKPTEKYRIYFKRDPQLTLKARKQTSSAGLS